MGHASMTSETGAFVAARLDEREAAAKAALPGPWMAREHEIRSWASNPSKVAASYTFEAEGAHIALHDPARVLREVAAWRAILAEYAAALAAQNRMLASPAGDQSVTYEWENGRGCALLNAVRGVAAAWSDHPDYDPAWAEG
jgi:hypothetical protein